MLLRKVVSVLFGLYGLLALAQPAPNQITNADIGKMLKAGVDQKIVKWVIDNSDGKMLDATPGAIQTLKAAGGSQAVVNAVSAKAAKGKKVPVSALMARRTATHSTKITHAFATVAALRKPATSARAAKQSQ